MSLRTTRAEGSVTPVTLEAPGRLVDLTLRVSAPHAGDALPIILLSHGYGPSNDVSSRHGYGRSGSSSTTPTTSA